MDRLFVFEKKGENKGADQLHCNREADQRCDYTGWFVSDLVGNPKC